MLNRRHIRVKVMQIIYALDISKFDNSINTTKQLFNSLEDIYDLYLMLITLLIEVQNKAESHLIISKKKHLATNFDKNPSSRFINNILLKSLKNNENIKCELKKRKLNPWKLDNEYVDVIFEELISSKIYLEYIESKKNTFDEDKVFLIAFFKKIIAPNEKLYEYLEDKNINWVDDFALVNTSIVKIFNKFNYDLDSSYFIPKVFKDNDDRNFALELMNLTLDNYNTYNKEISKKTDNWDPDRIANLDYVILNLAISEFLNFPTIPIKVTINEYIEIAKEYSSPKSNVFINGILNNIAKDFKKNNKIIKHGRGLFE